MKDNGVITLGADIKNAQAIIGPEDLENLRRMDASTTHPYRWLTRSELEAIKQDFVPNDGLALIPVDTDLGLWEEEIEIYVRELAGAARYANGDVDESDIELLSAKDTPDKFKVHEAFVGFRVNSKMLAMPTERVRRSVQEMDGECVTALDTLADQSLVRDAGKEKTGIVGFTTDKAVPKATTDHIITSTSDAEADLALLNKVMKAPRQKSRSSIRPDTLAMPVDTYDILSEKRLSGVEATVLNHFVEHNAYIGKSLDNVKPCESLAAAGPNGEDLLIPYRRDKSVVCVYMYTPRRFGVIKRLKGELVVWIMRHSDCIWKKPNGGFIWRMKQAS